MKMWQKSQQVRQQPSEASRLLKEQAAVFSARVHYLNQVLPRTETIFFF